MSDSELLIKINATAEGFNAVVEQVKDKSEELGTGFKAIGLVSAAAFGASIGVIAESVTAYAKAEEATNSLTAALQNQGIYSESLLESYQSQAEGIQNLTGVQAIEIEKSQALLQGMIGQTQISDDLTKAIVDLSAAKHMDLQSTTELVGKGIEGHIGALSKLGIEIDQGATKEERLAQITEILGQKFGGAAEAANQGLGGIKGLHAAFDTFQETLGEKFAPAIEFVIEKVTDFFKELNENEALFDVIAGLTTAGVVLGGLGTTVIAGALAFIKIKEAMTAFGLATNASKLAVEGLVGATGIGLLVILVTEVYLHWSDIFPKMQAIFGAFANNIGNLGRGLASILIGVFTLDKSKIQAGLDDVKNAFTKGYADFTKISIQQKEDQAKIAEEGEEEQDEIKKKFADKAAKTEADKEARKQAALRASNEVLRLEAEDESAATIALAKQESELLGKIADEKYKKVREQLLEKLAEIREARKEQADIDAQQEDHYESQLLANSKKYNKLSEAEQKRFDLTIGKELKASINTDSQARALAAKTELANKIKADNEYLQDEIKYGAAYASIKKLQQSEEFQGQKQAFGELSNLQSSNNATLRAIGKAAAIANITTKTAESAMNIYAGFSVIPFIGPALGIAAAAAAVAFGAEQIGQVLGAAEGGIATGGIPGRDSIPALLSPGELVVPTQNFDEVIGAVRQARTEQSGNAGAAGAQGSSGGGAQASVHIGFDGPEASRVITVRQNEDKALGIYRGVS